MISLTIYILLGIIIIGLATVIVFLYRKSETSKPTDSNSLSQLNQSVQGLETRVSRNIQEIQTSFSQRLDNTGKIMGRLNQELGVVQEMNKQMKDLQTMIKSPKLRGNIGEKMLENILRDLLPKEYYQTQFQFRDGQQVDAIIRLQEELIPIDSKFPIENFQKIIKTDRTEEKKIFQRKFVNDVKKHIRDISDKYIRPEEGTVNFAVMYVPSETIFYHILRSRKLDSYTTQQKILLVSPNTFSYFLQTIIIGIERNKISQASRQILANLKGIQRDARQLGEKMAILEKHIGNARKQMGQTKESFSEMKNKIDNTSKIEPVKKERANKPEAEEISVERI
jgi:DNA recombination protein RmuC